METLQEGVQWSSQPASSPNTEAYGYSGNQGSPTPGETASPKSYFQQSPALPASGLTEFSSADATSWDPSPDQPSELLATRDVVSTTDVPPKQYMGVRVKMPVRELLKKIRSSKGIDCNSSNEASVKTETKGTPGRTGKRRINSEKHHKPKRHNSRVTMKSVEDLDILVEVLEEDLNKSHSGLEAPMFPAHPDGASSGFQPHWWDADGNQWLDGNHPGIRWDSTEIQPHYSFPGPGALWHECARNMIRSDDRTIPPCPSPITTHLGNAPSPITMHSANREARHGPGYHPFLKSTGDFQGLTGEFVGAQCHNLPGHMMSKPLENDSALLQEMEYLKTNSGSFDTQDPLALSFFQFQLYQAENWLKTIPPDRLLAPDTNGNRVLHKAVAQGKRALAYVLAQRLALLNRIDEEDERKQTALHVAARRNHHLIAADLVSLGANVNQRDGSGKTPLHLCAERGHPRVLEVFKNCQQGGTHLEVDTTDNQGLTPLQCAVLAHSAIVMRLGKSDVCPEAWALLTLRKDRIWSGIACLLEMGADPWVQYALQLDFASSHSKTPVAKCIESGLRLDYLTRVTAVILEDHRFTKGTKSPSQASNYVAKVQGNSKLMSFLQEQRPKWEKDSTTVPGPDGMTFSYFQEDPEPAQQSFEDIFQDFPKGIL